MYVIVLYYRLVYYKYWSMLWRPMLKISGRMRKKVHLHVCTVCTCTCTCTAAGIIVLYYNICTCTGRSGSILRNVRVYTCTNVYTYIIHTCTCTCIYNVCVCIVLQKTMQILTESWRPPVCPYRSCRETLRNTSSFSSNASEPPLKVYMPYSNIVRVCEYI